MKSKFEFWRISSIVTAILTSACLAGSFLTASAQGSDAVAAVVAGQVRTQGFPCKGPISADRLNAESAPNETAYLLRCYAVTYRVVLIPDQAAVVTKVE